MFLLGHAAGHIMKLSKAICKKSLPMAQGKPKAVLIKILDPHWLWEETNAIFSRKLSKITNFSEIGLF